MSIRQRNAHFKDWAAVCKALSLSYSTDEVANEATARTALESSDNQFYYYVCYIKSAQVIYTHGEFYDCSYGKDEEAIAAALSSLATTKVGADNLKTINGESLVGAGEINIKGIEYDNLVYDINIDKSTSQMLYPYYMAATLGTSFSAIDENGVAHPAVAIEKDYELLIFWTNRYNGELTCHNWSCTASPATKTTAFYFMASTYPGSYILNFYVDELIDVKENLTSINTNYGISLLKDAINRKQNVKIKLSDSVTSNGTDVSYVAVGDMQYITLSFVAAGYYFEVNLYGSSEVISYDMINMIPISSGGSSSSCNSCVKTSLTNSGSYSFNKNVVNILELNPTNSDDIFSLSFNDPDPTSDINSGEIPTYKFNFYYNKYCTIGFTGNISWANGVPSFKLGYIYEISFVPNSNVNGVSWVGMWSESRACNLYELEPVSTGVYGEVTMSITRNGVPAEMPWDLEIAYDNGLLTMIQEGCFGECQISCPTLEGDYMIRLLSDTGEEGDFVSDSNGNAYLLVNNIISVE